MLKEAKENLQELVKSGWKILAEKGKLATLIGMFLVLPVNIKVLIWFFGEGPITYEQLKAALIINVIAVFWFILPSKFTFKTKDIEFSVTD